MGDVVTVSAPYGAAGSEIGPQLSQVLGVPFLAGAIPVGGGERLAMPLAEAVEYDEAPPAALERLLRAFATWGPSVAGTAPILPVRDGTMPEVTEQVIYEHAERTGGVILGRAGAIVLRDHPGALHVRLTGPPGARVEQAMRVERVDRPTAERRLEQTDRARAAYVNFFYGVDPHDPALYHLVLDSTALPVDTCVAIIAQAARARAAATPAPALR